MPKYLMLRLISMIPTMALLLLLVVALLRLLPGNAVDVMLADRGNVSESDRAQLEHQLGLDKTFPEAFVDYAWHAAQGDFGHSVWSSQSVVAKITDRLPVTLMLSLMALVIGGVLGVSIGVISAVARDSRLDYVLRSVSVVGLTLPHFALATAIVVLPTLWFGWSPSVIYKAPSDGLVPYVNQFIAPAAILAVGLAASLMRLTRTMMLEVLREDYVRTARAKGLGPTGIIIRHALRNALIPVVSLLGVQMAALLSGAVVVESVFGLPGVGTMLLDALTKRDYPMMQGVVLCMGAFIMLVNLAIDMSYGFLDPRTNRS